MPFSCNDDLDPSNSEIIIFNFFKRFIIEFAKQFVAEDDVIMLHCQISLRKFQLVWYCAVCSVEEEPV